MRNHEKKVEKANKVKSERKNRDESVKNWRVLMEKEAEEVRR